MALLAKDEIQKHLVSLAGWEVQEDALVKVYHVGSFVDGVVLIGAIAQLAEAAGHHPDLELYGYKNLKVALSTHDEGGITVKDVDLARQIEGLPRRAKA
jgi:4a-hydroxytetrahydrobiopterin dehydratase